MLSWILAAICFIIIFLGLALSIVAVLAIRWIIFCFPILIAAFLFDVNISVVTITGMWIIFVIAVIIKSFSDSKID